MIIYVYLDKSRSVHKNSKTKYFAVGGNFTFEKDKMKIEEKYLETLIHSPNYML